MDKVLKAGVIGVGILGRWHSQFLHQHPSTQVVAVADLLEDRAKVMAQEVGARAYRDYAEMLVQEKLDLVVVATPDPYHHDPLVAAAEAGVPYLVVEKPMATTYSEAKSMLAAARKAGARLWVNLAIRANPMEIASRYVIQQGLLGRVVYGEVKLDDNIMVPTKMWGDRSKQWAAGSSTAQFLFSHLSDLMRWYFDPAEVSKVYMVSKREVLGYTPDLYDGFLFFDSGLLVRIKAEWIKHIEGLVESYESFSGDKGTLIYNKIPGFFTQQGWRANVSSDLSEEDLLKHRQALNDKGIPARALVYNADPSLAHLKVEGGPARGLALEIHPLSRPGKDLMGYIIDAILEEREIPSTWAGNGRLPTGEDGLIQTQIVSAIVRSAEAGREVAVSEIE